MADTDNDDLIEVDRQGDTVILRLVRLSPLSASRRGRLQDRLISLAQTAPDRRVWLDFGRIEHLDNAALSLLVSLQQQLSGKSRRILLANMGPKIRNFVALGKLEHLFDIRVDLPLVAPPATPSMVDGFLQGIIEEPTDDAVRLIFADWLDERDDPRGEFIRVQMELAELAADAPKRVALEQRETQLLQQHEAEWTASLRSRVAQYAFRRGFVEQVALTGIAFIENAAELARLAPIRELRLYPGHPRHPDLIHVLLAWPSLGALHRLELAFQSLNDESIEALAGCAALANLRSLVLRNNDVGTAGIAALTASTHLRNLTTLDLRGIRTEQIDTEVINALRFRFGLRAVLI